MLRFRWFRAIILALGRELINGLCEVVPELMQRLERERKTRLLLFFLLGLGDALLELFKVNDNAVLLSKFPDPHGDIQRHAEVHKENAEEDAYEEGKFYIFHKDDHCVKHKRVDHKVEESAHKQPKEGKEGADDALNVPPTVGIVPKFDFHSLDEDEAGNVLDEGHRNAHDEDDEDGVEPRHACVDGNEGDAEQPREAESVEGEAGASQEPGVDPPFCTEEAAEEHFKTPAEDASHKEEEAGDQKTVEKKHVSTSI